MKHLNRLWGVVCRFKYVIVIVLGVIVVGFVDENSVLRHARNVSRISELGEEIDRYRGIYERDNDELRMLERNPKAIERIARERYFMKSADEDIFVLSDDL